MSLLRSPGRGAGTRLQFLLLAIALLAVPGIESSVAWAQEEVSGEQAVVADQAADLWSEVTGRYEVVVLSRGLLLEPLDQGVELRTIEIVDDQVAIDGEPVTETELEESIGDESAELVLRLAAMDRTERRQLFTGELAAVSEPTSDEMETDETAARDEADEADEARDRERRRYSDSQVSVGSSLTVHEDEVADEALVFGGALIVEGKVAGDAVAIGGSVTVSGEVTGDAVAVGGDLILDEGAEVLGDVVSVGGDVEIDDTARVRGQIIEVPFGPNLRFGAWPRAIFGSGHDWRSGDDHFELSPWGVATNFGWEAFKLIVLTLFAWLVLLVAREPLMRVKRRVASEPWKSGLVGLLVLILFAPLLVLVTLILVISIIGIPLVLLLPFFVLALLLVAFLGYVAVAWHIGEFLQRRFGWDIVSPYWVLLLGILTIQIWSIIGDLLDFGWGPIWFFAVMFGIFGALLKFIAWTVGLGAAVLTRFGTAEGWGGTGGNAYATAAGGAGAPPEHQQSSSVDEPSVLQDSSFTEAAPPSEVEPAEREEKPPPAPDQS